MKYLYRQLFLAVCLLVTTYGRADVGHMYTPDKLSSGLITCICQDIYGYIWIGTEYGLNKFDGYRYTAYHHNRKDSTTITDNEIATLYVDRQGQLWVGGAKGLSRYDYEHDRFVRYPFPDRHTPRVNSLRESLDGDLLIGTAGYGLFSMRKGGDTIYYEDQYGRRHTDDFFSHIHIDRKGNLWKSSHTMTVTRFVVKDRKMVSLRDYSSVYGQPVSYVEYSPQELLIVCMYGIMSYHYQTEELQPADFDFSLLDRNVSIEMAKMDRQGNLYIATAGCGLMIIPKGTRRLQRMENVSAAIDLSSAHVVDVMEDKDKNLWAACYNKGIMVISKQHASFSSWSFANQHFVTGGNIASIVQGEEQDLWCTVRNNGLYRLDATGHIIEHLASPAGTRIIYRDGHGRYWVTTENTLYAFNPKTGRATMEKTFGGKGLNCIVDDGKGRLYISVFGLGLCIYDPKTQETQMVSMQQTQRKEGFLCNDWIKTMTFDSRGMLWIATTNGTSMMDPNGIVFNRRGWNALLEGSQCYSLCETRNGDILISTEEGLFRYDWKKNKVAEEPKAQTLTDKMVCSMVKDNQGDIWISTTGGIWLLSDKRQEMVGYVGGNGLMNKEYIQGAALHTPDDRIYFGTADGITTFRPQDINNHSNQLGKVFLTRFYCSGHTLNPLCNDHQLPFVDNTFTLEFSTLDYLNAENIALQYRVNNQAWMQTNEGVNQITFTQLSPGEYTIEVRAVSNGIFSKDIQTLHIVILKPWYKSWWAYLFYIGILSGFLLMILYNWERQRRRDLEETKMRFLINATHDIRSPLTLIMGPLAKLRKRLTDPVNLADIDTIDKNAKRLMHLVNQILDERKIDKHQMKLSCTYTDLCPFIQSICKLYEYNARQRNITFLFDYPPTPVRAWIDHEQFDKVITNLLSNAFKYTYDNGEITVRLSKHKEGHHAIIEVIDDGMGFHEDDTKHLFERFYQGQNAKDIHLDGSGIGLNLCRAITEMHGGKISAANRTDGKTGAVLTIQLPLGTKHLKPEEIEKKSKEKDPEKPVAAVRGNGKGSRILVVDDDPEIGTYIKQELGEWYRIDYAADGKEAMKRILAKDYDLVVSDVMMPVMDGITLLKSIKLNPMISTTPVILLTSKSEVSFRLEGLKNGADAFIAKPFAMEELHIQIDNLINNVRRLRGKFKTQDSQTMEKLKVKGNDDALMDKVIYHINENISDPDFDIEILSEKIGISRTHLYRRMKKITGMSTIDFIRQIRMEQAARLIKEQKLNITQVGYAVGFNNQTHFSTSFKNYFGMNPRDYAAQMTAEEKQNKKE
ncbi:MAG: response regulator [Prevotella sp.]|nr:response regulator [Prevotella sp.]